MLRLTADDGAVSVSDDVTITVNDASTGVGTGLLGQYYNDTGNRVYFTTLALTRTDATVGFNWGNGAPATAVHADNFSVRWTGQVLAPVTGSYTFATTSDDGVRLWVNGQLLVDRWVDQSSTTVNGTPITLTGGTKYDVVMEYYERGGQAVAQLKWAYLGQTQQIVPVTQLFPAAGPGTGLLGQYYNDTGNRVYFTTLALTRTDATVGFNWGNGAPATAVHADNFSVRWTGQVLVPVTGSYTFATTSDDGVRLWVNGQLLVDRWVDQSSTTVNGTPITLTGGTKYDVVMEYYERGGQAVAQLKWAYPGQAQQIVPQTRLYVPGAP